MQADAAGTFPTASTSSQSPASLLLFQFLGLSLPSASHPALSRVGIHIQHHINMELQNADMDPCIRDIRGPAWQSAGINMLLCRKSVFKTQEWTRLAELAQHPQLKYPSSTISS